MTKEKTFDDFVKAMEEMNQALIEGKKVSELSVNTRDIVWLALWKEIQNAKPKLPTVEHY